MSVDVARANHERYGRFPLAQTFDNNDSVDDLGEDSQLTYSAAFDADDSVKRHAACDECRKRKLKCSGEPTGCARCVKQKLICHYSEQKQMGRPRKKQKTDDEPPVSKPAATSPRPIQPATPKPSLDQSYSQQWESAGYLDPSLATAAHQERSDFEGICPPIIARTIRSHRDVSYQQQSNPGLQSNLSDSSVSQTGIPTPDQSESYGPTYPTDVAQWPDFSTMDVLPLPLEDKYSGIESNTTSHFDPDANVDALSNLPPIPACPCLPNLYLTLSTLSTLSSFPFTWQTIRTIESGFKTAKGVIYCNVCPQKFDTGSSNLMLGVTLLNVLADQWNRFKKLGVDSICEAFGTADQRKTVITFKDGQLWRAFQHQIIRAYVFGDHAIPSTPGTLHTPESEATYPPLNLIGLCDALERRQKQWHHLLPADDEFPDRVTTDLQHGYIVGHSHDQPGKHLCLEIVSHAKCTIKTLDGPMRQ